MHRLPIHIVRHLQEARKAATLKTSNFDHMGANKAVQVFEGDNKTAETWKSMTDCIRDKVRLHHDSWIIGPIDEVLEWSESTDSGRFEEYGLLRRLRGPLPNPMLLAEAADEIERLEAENATLKRLMAEVARAVQKAEQDIAGASK